MESVIGALEELGNATTAEVVAHRAVDLSHQQVFRHLERLRERGVLSREQDDVDRRRVRWSDDGVTTLGEHGTVDLQGADIGELNSAQVRQLARRIMYTWDVTNRGAAGDASDSHDTTVAAAPDGDPVSEAAGAVDPPD